jgi:hypothetical protein
MPTLLCLLNCVTESIQVTEGRMPPAGFVLACPNIWQDVTSSESAQCYMFMSLKKEITNKTLVPKQTVFSTLCSVYLF